MENLQIENNADEDTFEKVGDEAFTSSYHLAHMAAVGLDKAYVIHVAPSLDSTLVAAALSTGHVNVYKTDGLVRINQFQPHQENITGIKFSPENESELYTCSLDQTVKLWDLRDMKSAKRTFKDTSDKNKHNGPPMDSKKPINTFDISCDGKVVCAGTEQVGCDAYLLFWDSRSGDLKGGYWESHQDDVTTVRFHPDKADVLATGSTDGQTNVFDISQKDEEDALTVSHNTEDSVAQVSWFAKKDDYRYLSIMTHTEGIQLWDTEEGAPYKIFCRSDVAHGIRRSVSDYTYLVSMHTNKDQGLTVVAGSSFSGGPCLRLATIKNKKIKPLANLQDKKVRSLLVRSSAKIGDGSSFVTGAEDGVVCVWTQGAKQEADNDVTGKQTKEKSTKKKRDKPY